MSLTRRKAIALIGGGAVFAASASTAAFLTPRTPQKALAPWDAAGGYDDPRLNALSFALLAPNPHNLQPWQVELVGASALLLHHDRAKRLPETDPQDQLAKLRRLRDEYRDAYSEAYRRTRPLFDSADLSPEMREQLMTRLFQWGKDGAALGNVEIQLEWAAHYTASAQMMHDNAIALQAVGQ